MCIADVGKGEARGEAGAGARGGMLGFSRFNLLRKEEEEKEEEEGRRQECLSKARRVSFSKGRVGGGKTNVQRCSFRRGKVTTGAFTCFFAAEELNVGLFFSCLAPVSARFKKPLKAPFPLHIHTQCSFFFISCES